MKRTTKY